MLDTNAVISIAAGNPKMVRQLRLHDLLDIGISSIVRHELSFGALRSRNTTENLARIDTLRFQIIDFDTDDAHEAAAIRAILASAGQTIGPLDVLIAGQARARGCVLVTHNTREFARVPGLRVEDWEA